MKLLELLELIDEEDEVEVYHLKDEVSIFEGYVRDLVGLIRENIIANLYINNIYNNRLHIRIYVYKGEE